MYFKRFAWNRVKMAGDVLDLIAVLVFMVSLVTIVNTVLKLSANSHTRYFDLKEVNFLL